MRVFIDVDLHQAIADFATRQPAPTYTFKSQDTIDFQIYFVQAGVVQDLGSGFALKFGMIKTGDATNTILAYQTACTYLTDSAGQVYYQMQVVMNTSQMATAIGTSASIGCTIELRYQDSLNEIIHTLNLAAIVFATILVETGVTPPGVSTGYPDASTIELLVHKNAASGYAGLDSGSHLSGAVIPVDGKTIALNPSGQLSSAAILAYTAANFTTPASGGTVSVTFGSTTNLKAASYVRIPIAGYYIVQSVTNATTAVLQNNGDPFNALSGVTITSGAVVLPAQAAAGGGGTPGQNAYTTLTAGFTVPAAGSTVSITVASTAWMPGSGYALFIGGAGYYLINSITDSTHVVVLNSGSAANQSPGTTVSSGATIAGAGPQGAPGATGASLSAYDALTAVFTQPAMSANVTITIGNTAWLSVNQIIYVAGGGYYQVATVANATTLSVTNLPYPGNASAGASIASGSKVSPAGLIGPQGAGGPGLNAFTTLSASFTQPAVNATVTVNIGTTAWMAPGQGIFIASGGYYTVSSIADLSHAVVTNVGGSVNAAPGSTVTGSGTQIVSPAGIPGSTGVNAYTVTTANFTTPAAGSSATINVGNTLWCSNGQNLFVAGAGYYQIASILSGTQLSATNLGANYGNTSGGTTINSGASVSPAGVIGPAGPAGPQGAAGRDGAYSTIYTGSSIQGTGGVASPATLVGDIAQGSGAYQVYQRNSSGNSVWGAIPVDGTTMTIASGNLISHGQQENLGAHIETPTAKTYTLDLAASSAYTIKSFKCILGAGTCTLALQQNGTNVSGAGAISVSTTLSTTALTQAVAANDKITIVLSSLASSPADLAFTMYIQR
jgi:hypothetical protein